MIREYLKRIHYAGSTDVTIENLFTIHEHHALAIPFENLDIHYNNEIVLNLDLVFDKVVKRKRGGFCYELNGLFHQLLLRLGYDARLIAANVYNEGSFGLDFDHMAIVVVIDEEIFLVDVGFGSFVLRPLRIQLEDPIQDPNGLFKFELNRDRYIVFQKVKKEWLPQYSFTLNFHHLDDYKKMCRYHQTNPASHFTQQKFISKPYLGGRISLFGRKLIVTTVDGKKEIPFESEDQFEAYLDKHFSIKAKDIKDDYTG